ncbi:hypothetical protein JOF56_005290 [Kibdelosporangium banguiense]|uniref:Uncharacterized protein n=1 Tax=Kibdelosporangium banguiense TaxID=1365924 RepID=A0ABS4TLQ9_9PSEU|nr:hypothetical protein [Kibdelosporangium banguiense]MBP2324905.1 hypothetical protein [Kibdelosporangium banguiense]
MWRFLVAVAAVSLLAGCSGEPQHGNHHAAPGSSGTAALGRHLTSLNDVSTWVQQSTDECDNVEPASKEELADYLGPQRYSWYEPFVAEWATCSVKPYAKLGLVVFKPGRQRALQEFWQRGMSAGQLSDNPDWAFGNGFAVTAGELGIERLGLRYLWCRPVDIPNADTVAADVDGCTFVTWNHH